MATGAVPALTRSSWIQPHQLIGDANTDGAWAAVDHKENIAHNTPAQTQEQAPAQAQTHLIRQQKDQSYHFSASTWHAAPTQSSDHARPQDCTLPDRDRQYAKMEAQLKVAQEELARLRAEEFQHPTGNEPAGEAPQCHSRASAAALLQVEHEKAEWEGSCLFDVSMHDETQRPQSSLDFPTLRDSDCIHSMVPEGPSQTTRKPSYANMATQGMLHAIGQNFPPSTDSGGRGSNTSGGSAYAHTVCSCTASHTSTDITAEADVGDDSVVVSPRSPDHDPSACDPVSTFKGSTPMKPSPRFAQPTVSFSRRADETIRKDSFLNGGKLGSIKKPSTICSPLQKQQKRKSLPGEWFGQSPESVSPSAQASTENHSAEHVDGFQGRQEPTLRKKTSTYMSPTKAATRRAIATIGHETALPSSPRLPRTLAKLHLHTDMTSGPSISQASTPTSPETAIETENVALRELQIPPRMRETLRVAVPRCLTVTGALSHSQPVPSNKSISDLLAAQAKAAGLPMPANTTTRRRGSHGHLLIPIKAKLDKIGILKEDPQPANVRPGSGLLSPVSQSSEPELFSPLPRSKFAVQPALPETQRIPQSIEKPTIAPHNTKKAVPPHVRAAMRDAIAAAEATRARNAAAAQIPSLRATAQEFRPMFQHPPPPQLGFAPQQSQMMNPAITQPLLEPQQHRLALPPFQLAPGINISQAQLQELTSLVPQPAAVESLLNLPPRSSLSRRFTTGSVSMPVVTDEDAKRFYDDEEWSSLTAYDRRRILERREALRYQDQAENIPDMLNAQPIALQGGDVLLPSVDPITNVVSWTLHNKVPVSLGSVVGPPTGPQHAADPLRNTPNVTSPRTPAPVPRCWTVGSEQARRVFGWKGGDGREIKFVGHGPDAEREPTNGVRFNYQTRMTSMGRGPRMIGNDVEDGSPEAPLAPRGRRQWAQLAVSPHQPCDKIDVVDAVEQMPIPYGPALHGFCDGCAVSSH